MSEPQATSREEFISWMAEEYVRASGCSSDLAHLEAEALCSEIDAPFGSADYDWSKSAARELAIEDMTNWEQI